MIVAATDDAYRFVTQPAHAALAGQFADRWGNDKFDVPSAAAVAAAYSHDDGWWAYDQRPSLTDDGTPVNFTAVPAATWIEIYDSGIEAAFELDPFTGLLVSLHGTGLRRRRYGLSPTWPDTPTPFAEFVDRQEARQREVLEARRNRGDDWVDIADVELVTALHETGAPPSGTESELWHSYALLQAWDTLSLSFCRTTEPQAHRDIGAVPLRPGGPEATLKTRSVGTDEFEIVPYPFATDPLVADVPTRTVGKAAFESEAELVAAYYAAGREPMEIVLRSE